MDSQLDLEGDGDGYSGTFRWKRSKTLPSMPGECMEVQHIHICRFVSCHSVSNASIYRPNTSMPHNGLHSPSSIRLSFSTRHTHLDTLETVHTTPSLRPRDSKTNRPDQGAVDGVLHVALRDAGRMHDAGHGRATRRMCAVSLVLFAPSSPHVSYMYTCHTCTRVMLRMHVTPLTRATPLTITIIMTMTRCQ